MKQPQIHIKDEYGKDWGLKPVVSLHWDIKGYLWSIQVDFMGEQRDVIRMYDYEEIGVFKNIHGNLIGELK